MQRHIAIGDGLNTKHPAGYSRSGILSAFFQSEKPDQLYALVGRPFVSCEEGKKVSYDFARVGEITKSPFAETQALNQLFITVAVDKPRYAQMSGRLDAIHCTDMKKENWKGDGSIEIPTRYLGTREAKIFETHLSGLEINYKDDFTTDYTVTLPEAIIAGIREPHGIHVGSPVLKPNGELLGAIAAVKGKKNYTELAIVPMQSFTTRHSMDFFAPRQA